jgi:ATP-dependent DNA helicase RecG
MTIDELKHLKESEDKVEFKKAKHNFPFAGGSHTSQEERRKCFLGYIVAFANEGGGMLVLGMADKMSHDVVGSDFGEGKLGELEDESYNRLGIRIQMKELFEDNKRVLLVRIPGRPIGKMLKFEGVPLMRVGESLRNMSDEEMFSILSEQEPDFSAKICAGLAINDLDGNAILKLKEAYSKKQDNARFLTLNNSQALSDLGLITSNGITYAALILIGKSESIKNLLPQSAINLEYRNTATQINFDNRHIFCEPYYLGIDRLWELINQRNGKIPVQQGPYIFDIPFFNKEVIREAINNAIAHRDYRITSEIVIKQFPNAMHIANPGGFPLGVTLENLLNVNSTPRNRLLADVMAKTGVVERSGQGIDKIFYQTISEAKPEPDYSRSDNYLVELRLSSIIEDKAFSLFIHQIQQDRKTNEKLSVHEVITLNKIRKGEKKDKLNNTILKKLVKDGLLEMHGKTKGVFYTLPRAYYEFTDEKGKYSKTTDWTEAQMFYIILQHLQNFDQAKMNDLVDLFEGRVTRKQVRYVVEKLVTKNDLKRAGEGKGTTYSIGENFINTMSVLSKALDLGFKQMKENGDIE